MQPAAIGWGEEFEVEIAFSQAEAGNEPLDDGTQIVHWYPMELAAHADIGIHGAVRSLKHRCRYDRRIHIQHLALRNERTTLIFAVSNEGFDHHLLARQDIRMVKNVRRAAQNERILRPSAINRLQYDRIAMPPRKMQHIVGDRNLRIGRRCKVRATNPFLHGGLVTKRADHVCRKAPHADLAGEGLPILLPRLGHAAESVRFELAFRTPGAEAIGLAYQVSLQVYVKPMQMGRGFEILGAEFVSSDWSEQDRHDIGAPEQGIVQGAGLQRGTSAVIDIDEATHVGSPALQNFVSCLLVHLSKWRPNRMPGVISVALTDVNERVTSIGVTTGKLRLTGHGWLWEAGRASWHGRRLRLRLRDRRAAQPVPER